MANQSNLHDAVPAKWIKHLRINERRDIVEMVKKYVRSHGDSDGQLTPAVVKLISVQENMPLYKVAL